MSHQHDQAPDFTRAFAIGTALNVLFVIIEAGFGFWSGSMALLSDAFHNLSDVLALLLSWSAMGLAARRPTARRTYGLKRATILSSLASALMLSTALGAVVWEAIQRLSDPPAVNGAVIMLVAGTGVFVNGITAWLFAAKQHSDLNIRAAYLHMAADTGLSLGVVAGGGLVITTGWLWVDPLLALVVSAIILYSGIRLLRESLDMAMDAVPRHIDPTEVGDFLSRLPGVTDVHDLHIWGMSTTETALTSHLVMPTSPTDQFLEQVATALRQKFRIHHPTLQIESGQRSDNCACGSAPCGSPHPESQSTI